MLGPVVGLQAKAPGRPAADWRQFAIALASWQVASSFLCLADFMWTPDRDPSVMSLLSALLTVIGWVSLSLSLGAKAKWQFACFTIAFWLALVAAQLAPGWIADATGSYWAGALGLPLWVLSGAPLHGIASFVPLDNQFRRTVAAALGMLVTSLLAFGVGFGFRRLIRDRS